MDKGSVSGDSRLSDRTTAVRTGSQSNRAPRTRLPEPRPASTAGRPAGSWPPLIKALSRYGTRPWVMAADLVTIVAVIGVINSTVVAAAGTALVFVTLVEVAGLYRSRLVRSALDDVAPLAGRLVIAATIVYALGQNGTGTIAAIGDDLGRRWWWSIATSIVGVVLARVAVYEMVRIARRREWVSHRTLIVGADGVGADLAARLLEHKGYGLRPVAMQDPFPPRRTDLPLPVHSIPLDQLLADLDISVVILAPVAIPDSELVDFVLSRHGDRVEIYFVPSLHQLNSGAGREVERVRSIPIIRLRRSAHRTAMWTVKSLLDRFLAAVLLLLLSPLLALLVGLVAVFIGRPVLFRQQRVGLDGQAFDIVKFRSLPPVDTGESDTAWAAESRRKPNTAGRLLRQLSLDELPQLWNIWRGDMSFVGPRPERPHFVGTFSQTYSHYSSRHRVRSGLTGLAQVSGLRGDTSIAERANYDNVYIETWSLGEDFKIMVRTVGSILRRSGE